MGQWLEIDHLVKGYGHGYWSTHGLDVTDGEIVAWMYAPTPVEF